MRRLVGGVAAFSVLLIAGTASAKGVNNLMAGINGVVTSWTDPVWSVVDPPEWLAQVSPDPVTPHILGLVQGPLMMAYRTTTGILDIALFPFWVFPTFSPEARYDFFNEYEVEYE